MRKLYLFFFISVLSCGASAQTAIYARFINYNNQVLRNDGTLASSTGLLTTNTINPNSNELFPLTTFTENTVQTLNIGSQSTGAGAGKIVFNPMTFTRPVDASSPSPRREAARIARAKPAHTAA